MASTTLGDQYVTLPSGTTAERPSPSTGMVRHNSTLDLVEYYNGSSWLPLDAENNIVRLGLIHYFDPVDYTGGSTWVDRVGNMTFTKSGSGTAQKESNSVISSSTSSSIYFAGSNSAILNVQKRELTMEMWWYSPVTSYPGYRFLAGMSAFWSTGDFGFHVTGDGLTLGFHTEGGAGIGYAVSSVGTGWKHVVGVRTTTGRSLYINGTSVATDTTVSTIQNTNSLSFGDCANNTGYGDYRWKFGSFRLYNRALSSTEITQNLNAERTRYGV